MNKTIAIVTRILATAAVLAPSAQAGVRIGFGVPLGAMILHHQQQEAYRADAYRRHQAREAAELRRERARARAAAAKAKKERAAAIAAANAAEAARKKAVAAAAAAAPAPTATVANTEAPKVETKVLAASNSVAPTQTQATRTAEKEPAKLECKRYFANVGMTISVPCTE